MDTCKEFNPYSCEEYISEFETKNPDFEEIRRGSSGERAEKI